MKPILFFTPSKDLLFNLWIGDLVKLRSRGSPIAKITGVKMVGRGHANTLYTVELTSSHKVIKVRDWNITSFAFKPET